jgi:hypothetical protein
LVVAVSVERPLEKEERVRLHVLVTVIAQKCATSLSDFQNFEDLVKIVLGQYVLNEYFLSL